MHGGKKGVFILISLLAVCRKYVQKKVPDSLVEAMKEMTWLLEQMLKAMKEDAGQPSKRRMDSDEGEGVASKRFLPTLIAVINIAC